MEYLKKGITSILIMLFLSSCSSGVQKTVRVEHVVCQQICGDDYMLGGPSSMALSDSILAVVDVKTDSLFHFFNIETGKYIRKCGIRGRGPSEFTVISSLNSCGEGAFSFYDANKKSFYYTNVITNSDVQFTH